MQAVKDKSKLQQSSVLEDLSMIGQLFSIASTAKPTTFKSSFNSIDGVLENGAMLNDDKSCVINLGGLRDGSYTIIVNSPETANYNMTIKYSSPDIDRPLILDINDRYIATYYLPKTAENVENIDAIFTFKIKLNAGGNKMKFHGDGFNLAPNLAQINLNMLKSIGTYNLTTVSVTDDGVKSVEIIKETNLTEENKQPNESIKIESIPANEEDLKVKEEISSENSLNINNVDNTIKEVNEVNEEIKENNNSNSENYLIQDIFKENSSLDNELMVKDSEPKITPIEISVSVPFEGLFDFSIPYLDLQITKIRININGVTTGILYTLNKNKENTVVNLHLYAGENKIKIYN